MSRRRVLAAATVVGLVLGVVGVLVARSAWEPRGPSPRAEILEVAAAANNQLMVWRVGSATSGAAAQDVRHAVLLRRAPPEQPREADVWHVGHMLDDAVRMDERSFLSEGIIDIRGTIRPAKAKAQQPVAAHTVASYDADPWEYSATFYNRGAAADVSRLESGLLTPDLLATKTVRHVTADASTTDTYGSSFGLREQACQVSEIEGEWRTFALRGAAAGSLRLHDFEFVGTVDRPDGNRSQARGVGTFVLDPGTCKLEMTVWGRAPRPFEVWLRPDLGVGLAAILAPTGGVSGLSLWIRPAAGVELQDLEGEWTELHAARATQRLVSIDANGAIHGRNHHGLLTAQADGAITGWMDLPPQPPLRRIVRPGRVAASR
ncbi:MAG: hypothetical protein HY903_20600 [Deltaproteobacteria bacterium]|nr:hypothetical protein [Deltaproteobacteria bacterium]